MSGSQFSVTEPPPPIGKYPASPTPTPTAMPTASVWNSRTATPCAAPTFIADRLCAAQPQTGNFDQSPRGDSLG